jgi:hypothetical protein
MLQHYAAKGIAHLMGLPPQQAPATKEEDNRRSHEVMQREIAEANEPRNRYQRQIDDWWSATRHLDADIEDIYMVGGFMERHSQTPGFHKHRRDRDWRVR